MVVVPALTLAVVAVLLGGEALWSRRNERVLRARGAVEPPGDVYGVMPVAYPGCFMAMASEGALIGPAGPILFAAGAALFAASKILKYWAIGTLGVYWSFRVLVVPGTTLVTSGPYRYLRHPNYVAVCGELVAMALMMAAPVTGLVSLAGFGLIIRRRIEVEERALGIRT